MGLKAFILYPKGPPSPRPLRCSKPTRLKYQNMHKPCVVQRNCPGTVQSILLQGSIMLQLAVTSKSTRGSLLPDMPFTPVRLNTPSIPNPRASSPLSKRRPAIGGTRHRSKQPPLSNASLLLRHHACETLGAGSIYKCRIT